MRYVIAILGLLVGVGALAGTKAAQISTLVAFGKQAQEMGPPPESVGVATAESQRWERSLTAVGSVATSRGVEVKSEVQGVVRRIGFESGQRVKADAVLVELDADVERAQLDAALANREQSRVAAARTKRLHEVGGSTSAELDVAEAAADVSGAEVKALRAQIAKKTIRAPFAGRLGIRTVNVGQLVSPGDTITVLEATHEVFVDFTVPQEQLKDVAAGMPVRIGIEGEEVTGSLTAIEPLVDPSTRATRLRSLVVNPDERLLPGMFVDVAVILPEEEEIVVVPATAVVHASYGDSVFVAAEKPKDEPGMRQTEDGQPVLIAQQRFVRTGARRGDFITVLEGVAPGEPVVSSGAFKLKHGMPIVISGRGVTKPELEPELQNR